MPPDEDPFVARRQIRTYLRRLREESGMTQVTAAQTANITSFKLARIESGETAVEVNDLRFLLEAYGVPSDAWPEWIDRARVSRSRSGRWQKYQQVISREFRTFLAHESQAKTMHNFEPFLMPGLLQTAEYSKEVLQALAESKNVAALAQLRKERQEQFRDGRPTRASFVIDEAVLYRQVGGPSIMRRQLEHLKEMATAPNVGLHVMPFHIGLYPHWREPFVLFDSDLDVVGTVLYLESPEGEHIIRESNTHLEPAKYQSDFYLLQQTAPAENALAAIDTALAYIDQPRS